MSFPGLFTLILALSCMPGITATPCCNASSYSTQSHYEHVLSNYLNIWNGDLSLINSTFSPNISVHADRFPSPAGVGSVPLSATTSADFEAFVQRARNGWDKYTFVPYRWVAGENKIAVRWMLDAIMGANFTLAPTTLKQGDPLTYNGTDFLILDECTGLIDEAHIAQDLITLFHNLGLTAVTV